MLIYSIVAVGQGIQERPLQNLLIAKRCMVLKILEEQVCGGFSVITHAMARRAITLRLE